MNAFFRLGRLQEKSLLGETNIELNSLDCLRPVSRQVNDDSPFNMSNKGANNSSGGGSNIKKSNSLNVNSKPKSPEDLRHSAI